MCPRLLVVGSEDAPGPMKAVCNAEADHQKRLLLRKREYLNTPLTNALKGVTTSFPNRAATTPRYFHGN